MFLRFIVVIAIFLSISLAHGSQMMTTISAPTPTSEVNHNLVTVIDRANRLPNGMHIERLGLYSVLPRSVKVKIVQRTAAGAYTVISSAPWPHLGGGWQWLSVPAYDVPASGDFYMGYYYPSTANNLIGCNPSVARATTSPDIGVGSYTGITENTGDVAAMAASSVASDQPFSKQVAGIIRPDGIGGWYILNDGDHGAVGLSSVVVHYDYIEVLFDAPFTKLVTFNVGVDDDLAKARIMAGASTGLTKIGITLTDENGTVSPASVTNTLANIQIYVLGY